MEAFVTLGEQAHRTNSIGGLVLANVDLPPRRGDMVMFNDVVLRSEGVNGMTMESAAVPYLTESNAPDDRIQQPEASH